MNNPKTTIFTFLACSSVIMPFLGCDGSKTEPAPQQTGAVATQVVATVTSAALPTGTVAVAAKPAEAKSVPVEKKPKQPQEPEVGGINMNGLRSIEVKVSDTPDLTAFMEYIEIIKPVELRDRFRNNLKQTLKKYK